LGQIYDFVNNLTRGHVVIINKGQQYMMTWDLIETTIA
jgi:hypothetical protein